MTYERNQVYIDGAVQFSRQTHNTSWSLCAGVKTAQTGGGHLYKLGPLVVCTERESDMFVSSHCSFFSLFSLSLYKTISPRSEPSDEQNQEVQKRKEKKAPKAENQGFNMPE